MTSLSARRAWIEISDSLDDILAGVVALRKESVDRNKIRITTIDSISVALRKESVDRNHFWLMFDGETLISSLSARRAWIEIAFDRSHCHSCGSLSARRAWIEMGSPRRTGRQRNVALRKESVDRNISARISARRASSRSPQGERG